MARSEPAGSSSPARRAATWHAGPAAPRRAGVAPEDIYRDVGVSGSIGTNSRPGWHTLDGRLTSGDTLVVAASARIGGAGWTR